MLRQLAQGDLTVKVRHQIPQDLIHPLIMDPPKAIILLHPFFYDKIRSDQIQKLIINTVFQEDSLSFRRLIIID